MATLTKITPIFLNRNRTSIATGEELSVLLAKYRKQNLRAWHLGAQAAAILNRKLGKIYKNREMLPMRELLRRSNQIRNLTNLWKLGATSFIEGQVYLKDLPLAPR